MEMTIWPAVWSAIAATFSSLTAFLTPAVWSAIAATFSALTAFLTLRLHLTNQRDSVRPDLIVEKYELHKKSYSPSKTPTLAAITFPLKNVGKGPALNTRIHGRLVLLEKNEGGGVNAVGVVRLLIPPGEESPSESLIEFFWPRSQDFGFMVEIHLYYFDLHNRLYHTAYEFSIDQTDSAEDSVDGHIIDALRRKTREVPTRAVARTLKNIKASHAQYAPVPMAYYFDQAEEQLAQETTVDKAAAEGKASCTSGHGGLSTVSSKTKSPPAERGNKSIE